MRKNAGAFCWKVAQNMQKKVLFQTYVLIHQPANSQRDMIILVQNGKTPSENVILRLSVQIGYFDISMIGSVCEKTLRKLAES